MPKLVIVYGLLDENDGVFSVSFPDAPKCTGQGVTRQQAIENGEERLRTWVGWEEKAGRTFTPRTTKQLSYDDAVKVALQLGMEMVAVPL